MKLQTTQVEQGSKQKMLKEEGREGGSQFQIRWPEKTTMSKHTDTGRDLPGGASHVDILGKSILGRETSAKATSEDNTWNIQGTAKRPIMWLEKNT